MKKTFGVLAALLFLTEGQALALPFTMQSPTSAGNLPSAVSISGGIVADLIGVNGERVISQVSGAGLFRGQYNHGTPTSYYGNPGTIGVDTNFSTAVLGTLGGGITELALRVTLKDGDNGPGNFDFNQNQLLVNSIPFGNFSSLTTERGNVSGGSSGILDTGFRDNSINTGFFYSNDLVLLNQIFDSMLLSSSIVYKFLDADPYENFLDFTAGYEKNTLIVSAWPGNQPPPPPPPVNPPPPPPVDPPPPPPVDPPPPPPVDPPPPPPLPPPNPGLDPQPAEPVPEPGTLLLFGSGLIGLYRLKTRRDRRQQLGKRA